MHPALSIIVFTTASGAGYGLLFLLGLGFAAGLLPPDRWFGGVALGLSLVLICLGLAASTLHLGHPERAWRAVTQWRSSWLSREGVAALATFLPAGALGLGWVLLGEQGWAWRAAAALAAIGALGTVYCTAQIYATLKPIRQWHHRLVVPLYLLFALATGALWLVALLVLFGGQAHQPAYLGAFATTTAWLLRLRYWRDIDSGRSPTTIGSATGLGGLGQVRLLEPPHSEENYLLKEMGYRVARKHAAKLRRVAGLTGLLIPLLALSLVLATAGWWEIPLALLAAASGLLGALIERWLFFAEATHSVMLYYGRAA